MQQIRDFFEIILHSDEIIKNGGMVLLLIIIFAETGIVIGFIFPGDALLFTAGLLCGSHLFVSLWVLVLMVGLAAVAGNYLGFITGKYIGKRLFHKKDTLFFKQRHLEKTHAYYEKYGGFAIIGGRFIPVVRTFVPILAGAIDLELWKFTLFNIAGAFLWSGTLIPLGFFIGRKIPASIDNIEYFALGITAITMTILIRGFLKMKKTGIGKDKPE